MGHESKTIRADDIKLLNNKTP